MSPETDAMAFDAALTGRLREQVAARTPQPTEKEMFGPLALLDDALARWVDIGVGYASSLPPKR